MEIIKYFTVKFFNNFINLYTFINSAFIFTIFSFSIFSLLNSDTSYAEKKSSYLNSTNTLPNTKDRSVTEKLSESTSPYTNYIIDLIQNWSSRRLHLTDSPDSNPVLLQCITTDENQYYIGLAQQMQIEAPLSEVEKVLDNFSDYNKLFPSFSKVEVIAKDHNLLTTYWEQTIPIFFISNISYQLFYIMDKHQQNRKIYRYQLKESKTLKANDGFIILEGLPSGEGKKARTQYYELDFYDAEWGALKTFAPGRIWKDSVEGIYLSDLAIKLRSENPTWSYQKVEEEAKKILNSFPVDRALKRKLKLEEFNLNMFRSYN